MYRDPGEYPISFGDIFEGDHLIDVHARRETRPMGGGDMPRKTAERMSDVVNRPLIDSAQTVPVYTPALSPAPESFHALAFGGQRMKQDAPLRAILLSDSCAVDTALGTERGQRTQGRLLFAPIAPATEAQVTKLKGRRKFGSFPLPEDAKLHFEGGIAQLKDCFMVDARDVLVEDRLLSLCDEAAAELEAAWDACALRRGPHVVEHNVAKLARSLADGEADADTVSSVEMIAQTLIMAWRLEGGLLRAAADSPEHDESMLQQLVVELKELEESARTAHERLTEALSPGAG